MAKQSVKNFSRSRLHPMSIKAVNSGHPWITKDEYSKKFSRETSFIVGQDGKGNDKMLLLNDPSHPHIKARLWSTRAPFEDDIKIFGDVVASRLTNAFKKRDLAVLQKERQNIYIAFGEADFLPGLFILLLDKYIFIQNYCTFWDKKIKLLARLVPAIFREVYGDIPLGGIWMQSRDKNQNIRIREIHEKNLPREFNLKEFNINYSIRIGKKYDIGIYTDMASIRFQTLQMIKKNMHVLNLYSYTGSFSLQALQVGAKEVVSVDISGPNNKWLEHNIKINPKLSDKNHQIIESPAEKVISKFVEDRKRFDFIICDPPSFSHSEGKVQKSIHEYRKLIPGLSKLLNRKGKLVLFLNTHKISRAKFEKEIMEILKKPYLKKSLKIVQTLKMGQDCPTLLNFPEGDYLKGVIIEKN
ncbi:MAG: class I SAM-dependent methyltransferase [Bacteriovoracaceae bacterium]|nr:class I SAM-dependent methyltransferase [Bacteriovoracaceae bacterium]